VADHQLDAAGGGRVEAGDQDADADAVDQHHPLQVEADLARRGGGQHVVDGVPHHVGVVEIDLAAGRDLDGAIGQLAGGDRQIHGCPLPGVERADAEPPRGDTASNNSAGHARSTPE
jgi:hypothetical protein